MTKDCFFISFPVAEKVIYMQGLQQTAPQQRNKQLVSIITPQWYCHSFSKGTFYMLAKTVYVFHRNAILLLHSRHLDFHRKVSLFNTTVENISSKTSCFKASEQVQFGAVPACI